MNSTAVKDFFDWYKSWYKPLAGEMNIMFSVPNELHLQEFRMLMVEENVVVLELFEKIDQGIDAKVYMRQICDKADELGVTIYLEPMPRYKYFRKNIEKRKKVSKEYLFAYYAGFGFEPTSDNRFMKRTPKMNMDIDNMIDAGIVQLEMYDTTPQHAAEYGLTAVRPLYLKNLCVDKEYRLKKVGKSVLEYIEDYARRNGHDIIFGHVARKADFTKDERQTTFCDVEMIKYWLHDNGYAINDDNNDFHKEVQQFAKGGVLDSLNPTGSIFADYTPEQRDNMPLAPNITTYSETADIPAQELVAVYRGSPYADAKIVSGDFVTTNKQLAKDYAGTGFVISRLVRADEILDDIDEPLGEEYILRLKKSFAKGGQFHLGGDMSKHLAPNGKPSNLTHEQWHLVRTPEFKAWFGDWENDPENASKVLDINNEPLIMWHGSNTMEKINIFQSNKGHDYSFFTNDYNEAKRYVENFYRVHPDEIKNRIAFRKYYDSKIKKFYIKAIKPFEYNKLSLDKLNQLDEFLLLHVEELHNLLMKYIEHSGMSYALYLLDLDIDPKISKFDLLKYFLQRHSDDWWILEAPVFQNYIKNNGYDAFITKESGAWNIAVYKPNQIKLADGSNTTFDGSNPDIRYAKGGEIDTENMLFWHGGDLSEYNENIAQKSGRYEYGAGLYLTTELRVATKYSKGRRRLYLIEVEKGQEISDATIPENKVHAFIDRYVIGSKKKEIKHRLEKYTDDKGRVKAGVFNNIILNEKAIQSTKTYNLREFYVENGIDYELVDNAFGWGETMMVLYNMKKIVNKKTVSEKEAYQMGSIKREDKTDDAKNTFEIGGSVEKVDCPNKITSYNQLNW